MNKPSLRILKRSPNALVVLTDCSDDEYYNILRSATRVLRVSGLHGERCGVKPLLEALGAQQTVPQQLQDIFELGHVLEPIILRNLEREGWKVEANNRDNAKKRFIYPLRGGMVTGTPDAVAMHPERTKGHQLMCDAKTMNMNRFDAWLAGRPTEPGAVLRRREYEALPTAMGREEKQPRTRKVFPGYYLQVSLYAMAVGLDFGMIAGYDKNTSRQKQELFRTDPELALAALARAELALTATSLSHVSGCTGKCSNCFLESSCKKLKSDSASLKEAFKNNRPLAPGADPINVLTVAFDVIDERGRLIQPLSETARKALYVSEWNKDQRPVIAPELMSRAELEEYEAEHGVKTSIVKPPESQENSKNQEHEASGTFDSFENALSL